MKLRGRNYRYVGPPELRALAHPGTEGRPILSVADALDAVGIGLRTGGFTHAVVFRRCPACGQLNIVRDGDFVCVFCDGALPPDWNVDPSPA
ncbi:hypothetical protein [Streptomyces avidinii]|uniref:Uncharacterized protein n=1 Tax=Streptomyces avidinii TaxID=1895 RepID=A0ABS4LEW7_STRAV|nr:hypothetical protein [Streptomyces avidinii]MBP2040641.1 hypothetical protein [Streptomyces avidinii]GGZ31239.1 hypothetical protein GCM10010343_68410 [Streptomyces avidinii]